MFTNSPYPFHTGCVRNSQISPPISCTFEFDRSTPWTFYPPTHLLTPHSQSLITVWPTISFFTCPSFFTLIHRHICSFLYFHTCLSVHHLSTLSPIRRILGLLHPPANLLLQTCTREDILLEIFATARDSFPFVASTAPGQDPVGSGSVIFLLVVFARCSSFFVPPIGFEAMERLCLACLVRVK